MKEEDSFCMVRGWNLTVRVAGPIRLLALVVCLMALIGCREGEMGLDKLMPQDVEGWRAEATGRVYDRNTLFEYIDGGAELYLAYGLRQMVAQRFERERHPAIVVDLFDMGSSEDAFGVFTSEQREPEAGIGQGSEYAAGLLRFWKGNFFVSIWAEGETSEAERAILALGAAIAKAIEPPGDVPELLGLLPKEDLVETGIRYFHDHVSLGHHYFMAEENILGLSERTEAVLARYRVAGGTMYLLLVRYPTPGDASAALHSFVANYLPEGRQTGIGRIENGKWAAARRWGDVTMMALEAPARTQAERLLDAVTERLEE